MSTPDDREPAAGRGAGSPLWPWAGPTVLLLALFVLPWATGQRTLFMRDVLNTHFEMQVAGSRALAGGSLALVDPWRSGGQAHLGNPNTLALYPGSLLFLVADPLWALNAHFWIHWLLAPFTFFWLGRAWGLGRPAAWAGAVCYASSGFFLSNLNLYNLMAAVTWAPALMAAALDAGLGRRPRAAPPLLGGAWALLVLGGDPMSAALALALAVSAAPVAAGGWRRVAWRRLAAPLALGTLVAAPQIVEFLRILPYTFRGYWGFSEWAATAASWHPASLLEWLLPFAFGRPDFSYWGAARLGGAPLYFSLYPGIAALVLLALSGRPWRPVPAGAPGRGLRPWAWSWIAVALFLALGRNNPVVVALLRLGGSDLLRLPVKTWLAVASGCSLLCGLGFERLAADPRGLFPRRLLTALALGYAAAWALLLDPEGRVASWLRAAIPAGRSPQFADHERVRWAGLCLVSLLAVGAIALLLAAARRRPTAALSGLLALHLALQLLLLRPLAPTDEAAPYRRPPPLAEVVPEDARMVQGDANELFGTLAEAASDFPDPRLHWLERHTREVLYPWAAVRWRRRVELAISPEGLDMFVTRATAQAMQRLPDADRLRLLAATGVEYLVLSRDLARDALPQVELVAERESAVGRVRVYRLRSPAPEVAFVGRVARAPHLNEALARVTARDFDPRLETVLADSSASAGAVAGTATPPAGAARWSWQGPERVTVEVDAARPGALVVQRTYLPLYRARIDGAPVAVAVANLHRLAVEVPAGRHTVEIFSDRRPLALTGGLSLLAVLGLGLLSWRGAGAAKMRGPRAPGSRAVSAPNDG